MTAAERMRAYRARKRAAGLRHSRVWIPIESTDTTSWSDHRLLEIRSLALHALIARKIDRNPRLLDIARANLRRWKLRAAQPPPAYLDEWSAILEQPWPDVARFITDCSENAVRLRQSSPFAGVLDPQERKRIYDAFRT